MRFRTKVLLLLLLIGIVPPLLMRLIGVRAVHRLGDDVMARYGAARLMQTQEELRLLVASYAEVLQSGQRQVEMALRYQAQAVQQALQAPPEAMPHRMGAAPSEPDPPGDPRPANLGPSRWHRRLGGEALPVSFSNQAFRLPPDGEARGAAADIRRLMRLTPVYRALHQQLAGIVLWHSTCLASGIEGIYPGVEPSPGAAARCVLDPDPPQPTEEPFWIDPIPDPLTGQSVLAAVARLTGPDGVVLGATRMEVPIARLIDRSQLAANVPAHARILVCHPRPHPDGERPAARILATARSAAVGESGAAGSDGGDSQGPPLEGNWLESDQPAALEELLRDVQAGNGGIRRMPFQGQDCQWVYAAARSGVFLLVIVPQEQILVPVRDAEAIIHDLVDRLIRYTTLVLAALLVGIVLLALRFSRSVTRPIQDLEQGAARLAAGDFDARVTIDSRDEFGDMGRIFNRVGPQLREHTRLRAALEVAREVQQNLMPRELPHVAGLQLAARVEYCDQTGGDYYDVIGPDASGGTYLAIGDASEHGVSAALLMATTRALLRQRIANGGDLADIVADVNRQLAADVDTTGRFVTLLVVRLDPQRGELRWVRAGHEPALIYAAARGTWEALQETGGPPLGVAEAARYRETVRRFAPGDILVMATDGLREVRDPSGAMLGRSALERIVQRLHAQDCATILTEVWETLHRFRGVRPLEDDITLMVVRPAALTPAPDAAGAAPPS